MAAIPEPPEPAASQEPSPPTRLNRRDLNTPCQSDGFFAELVSIDDPSYQNSYPIKRGQPYSETIGADQRVIDEFATNPLYFLKQTADLLSMRVRFNGQYDNFVIWIWASNTLSQDTYNADIVYVDESASTPQFTRTYEIRRVDYDNNPTPPYTGSLTALLSVAITAPGTGYTKATGTVGNATAVAVCLAGAIVDWIVTIEGSSIVSGASLTIVGDGTGATATARIQPASAVLVSSKKVELPEDDPKSHDYIRVIDVFQTLPGAILTEYDQDEETQVNVKTTYQIVANPISAPSQTNGILVSYRKIDAQKSLKIIRDFTAFLSFSFDEQKFAADQFPSLFDWHSYFWSDACGAFSTLRSGFSAKTQIRTHVTYTATKQTFTGLVLLPESLMLGRGFQINQQVLVDSGTITYSGNCTGSITFPGSSPTYSDYTGTIQGTEQLVAGESVLWKAGIYRNTAVYEIML